MANILEKIFRKKERKPLTDDDIYNGQTRVVDARFPNRRSVENIMEVADQKEQRQHGKAYNEGERVVLVVPDPGTFSDFDVNLNLDWMRFEKPGDGIEVIYDSELNEQDKKFVVETNSKGSRKIVAEYSKENITKPRGHRHGGIPEASWRREKNDSGWRGEVSGDRPVRLSIVDSRGKK